MITLTVIRRRGSTTDRNHNPMDTEESLLSARSITLEYRGDVKI
jgi:hypothetical protein